MNHENYWSRLNGRRMGRRSILGGAAALGGLAVAGCGDDDKPKATATSAPAGTASAAATGAASAQASATAVDLTKLSEDDFFKALPENPAKTWKDTDIKTGGRLTRTNLAANLHLDFFITQASRAYEFTPPVYSRLVRFSASEGMKNIYQPDLEGDLATKWEQPDPQSLVLTLAPGIKWQNLDPLNGREFKAEDIAFSFERGRTFAPSQAKGDYANFTKVEAVGSNQVKLTMAKPDPLALSRLAYFTFMVMPPEIGTNPDTAKTRAVGTGAFQVKNYTPNVEMVFDKNPNYWKTDAQGRKLPYLDGYTVQMFQDITTAMTSFEAGRAESMQGEIFPFEFAGARDFNKRFPTYPIQVMAQGASSWNILGHNNRAPWNDIRVRRALNMLLPRDQASKSLYKGLGFCTPFFPWPTLFEKVPTTKDLGQWFQYNPAEAKKLLEAAGVLSQTWDVDYFESANPAPWIPLLQQEAAQIGLKLNMIKGEPTAVSQKISQKAFKDLAFQGRGITLLDPEVTMRSHVTGNPLNWGDISDPVVDEISQKFATAMGDARKQLGKQLWDRMLDQVFEVPLALGFARFTWSPKQKNFVSTVMTPTTTGGQDQMAKVWLDPAAKTS